MRLCPHCSSDVTNEARHTLNLSLSWCPTCVGYVLPFEAKEPKKIKSPYMGLKRTPLAKRSHKQVKLLKSYKASSSMQAGSPKCCRCEVRNNLEQHHPFGRLGKIDGVNAIELWFYLCNICHTYIHAHANEAMESGLLQPEFRQQKLIGERKEPWKK